MPEEQLKIPDNIGRNDPCPCGSGKKYKKCHYLKHQIEKEAQKTTVSVETLVGSKSSPWDLYKILTMIAENNIPNLLWELGHDKSPFREKYPTIESYVGDIAVGVQRLPASDGYDLLRIRHDGPDVKLLVTSGHDDPKMQSVRAEIITLRPNQIDGERQLRKANLYGYRIWSIDYATCPKSEIGEEPTFENFGVKWAEKWKAPEGWYRPIPVFSNGKQDVVTASPAMAVADAIPANSSNCDTGESTASTDSSTEE